MGFILNDKERPVRVKLCDFGLSEYCKPSSNGLTLSNKFCGKANYKSPEVIDEKRPFDPKKNDIWCLGVSLFMMIIGVHPWAKAIASDPTFVRMINGDIFSVLKEGNKLRYINRDLIELFAAFFKYEQKRMNMANIKKCRWSNDSKVKPKPMPLYF